MKILLSFHRAFRPVISAILSFGFPLLLGGCPDDPGSGSDSLHSCDYRDVYDYCLEYRGLEADGAVQPYRDACDADGTWTAAPCPLQGSVGACESPAGEGFTFTIATWFYDDVEDESYRLSCEEDGESTWIDP